MTLTIHQVRRASQSGGRGRSTQVVAVNVNTVKSLAPRRSEWIRRVAPGHTGRTPCLGAAAGGLRRVGEPEPASRRRLSPRPGGQGGIRRRPASSAASQAATAGRCRGQRAPPRRVGMKARASPAPGPGRRLMPCGTQVGCGGMVGARPTSRMMSSRSCGRQQRSVLPTSLTAGRDRPLGCGQDGIGHRSAKRPRRQPSALCVAWIYRLAAATGDIINSTCCVGAPQQVRVYVPDRKFF